MQNPLLKSRPIPDQLTPGQLTANPRPPTQPDPATPKPAGKGDTRSSRPVGHWLAAGPGGSFEFEWVLADLGGPGEDHDRTAVTAKTVPAGLAAGDEADQGAVHAGGQFLGRRRAHSLGYAGLGERVEEERDVEAVEGQAGQRAARRGPAEVVGEGGTARRRLGCRQL